MKSNPLPRVFHSVNDTIHRALAAAGLMRQANSAAAPATAAPAREAPVDARDSRTARFTTHRFTHAEGSRTYKLYVPASLAPGTPAPLVMMLHGCTQDPDDFAAGTRMNALAEAHGFLVVYPQQDPRVNPRGCWNWFQAKDQAAAHGEPAILAALARAVAAEHPVDERRVYVAGLSAGGAMAVILGATHPEVFAAIGVHSGLPYRAARDVQGAFGAMRTGAPPRGKLALPVIVFHARHDPTVAAANGAAIVAEATQARGAELRRETQAGPGYSRTSHVDGEGQATVEYWMLEGATHAWSGGSPQGTFTDANGPDASTEMVRFFLSQGPNGAP